MNVIVVVLSFLIENVLSVIFQHWLSEKFYSEDFSAKNGLINYVDIKSNNQTVSNAEDCSTSILGILLFSVLGMYFYVKYVFKYSLIVVYIVPLIITFLSSVIIRTYVRRYHKVLPKKYSFIYILSMLFYLVLLFCWLQYIESFNGILNTLESLTLIDIVSLNSSSPVFLISFSSLVSSIYIIIIYIYIYFSVRMKSIEIVESVFNSVLLSVVIILPTIFIITFIPFYLSNK